MDEKEMKELLDRESKFAADHMMKHSKLAPMFIAFNHDTRFVMAVPFETDKEKYEMLDKVKLAFAMYKVTHYVYMGEIWIKACESRDEFADFQKRGLKPSSFADKMEGVMTILITHETKRGVMQQVIRGFQNKVSQVVPFRRYEDPSTGISGDFTELLPPPGFDIPFWLREPTKKFLKMYMMELDLNGTRN